MVEVKHLFESPKTDGSDTTLVQPGDWNDLHKFDVEAASVYLGRDQSGGVGPVQELPVVVNNISDDGTLWTAAKVAAYVAEQIAAVTALISPIPLGTIVGSINGTMPGFLPLNGTSFGNVGSGATHMNAAYQGLFTHIWTVMPAWPIVGGRGASAAADWAALKRINMPNGAEHVLGAAGGYLGTDFFASKGESTHLLTVAEMPSHQHAVNLQVGQDMGLGGTPPGNLMQRVSDGPYNTEHTGGGAQFGLIQKTLVMQTWWIKY